ncbi:fasciclin domain-containing protein [Chitinophaga nivalis]|uniref:Fasciclin domain-containing protein n=1 Tax=Chitinophaga nivalis TaxID=2991709 RepID=A0ABT3IJV9_9BACT|nr:fasciclin domain-containing protein [Chitinophaga nivalis]MCW3466071.1 fasciclin domain-containing protein [Chitinophaga nivalis]MCW3484238.1 fasciclin domain-containing protein [Chitinophaga nivalis]
MRDHTRYIIILLLLLTAGCIHKDAIDTPSVRAAASLRSLLTNNFSFSMFYEAMRKAGVDTLLDNEASGYTLLIPDNGAFERSGITPDSLRKMLPEAIRKMVLYHVVPGKVSSTGIPQTLNYPFVTLGEKSVFTSTTVLDTNLYVNGIAVVKKNIAARNGVIHALKEVLTVPAGSVQEILAGNPHYSCLVAGLKKFGYWEALATQPSQVILAPTNEAFAMHHWEEKDINNMKTTDYKKLVFGSYVMNQVFFFTNDVRMAPPQGPFLQGEVLLFVERANTGEGIRIKVMPLNYRDPEFGLRIIFYGDWVNIPYSRPGQQAVNGIVHQVDQLPVVPDSALIR